MIVDIPSEVQMAIRLRAVKSGVTTGDVVTQAVQQAFCKDLEEARNVLADQKQSKPVAKRQTA